MKRFFPGLLTLGVVMVIAWSGLRREVTRDSLEGLDNEAVDPVEARVQSLLQSARDGDLAAYLAAFDEPMRARIERELDEKGRDVFVSALQLAARSRKSRAVFAPVHEGDDVASVVVETIYRDHNERQTYRLGRKWGGWLITDVTILRGEEPPSRYGATAKFQEPEGVPVQAARFPDDVAGAQEPDR